MAILVHDGIQRMYRDGEDVFYYLTLYNENYPMPAMPEGVEPEVVAQGVVDGLYRWKAAPEGLAHPATILFSGTGWTAADEARTVLADDYGVGAELWSATSYKALREQALEVERWNRLHPTEPDRVPQVVELLGQSAGPIVAVSDFVRAVPDQIARWAPRPWLALGTDGFGRSDDRAALRRFFETDTGHVVVAVLSKLADAGEIEPKVVQSAIERFEIDSESRAPWVD
jgi:pyruvate dehydrogenase E1 component